ncbi:MAG: hypothetical protein ACFFGZ_00615 [Candidatus Thorarchaeota archaeon]
MIDTKLDIVIDQQFLKYKDFIERITTEAISPLPKIDITVFFYKENPDISFFTPYINLEKIDLNEFQKMIQGVVPFSFGYEDQEFLFIVVETEDYQLFIEEPDEDALKGLLMHEYMHSVQRQRGIEDDLRKSMAFPLDFFENMAGLMRNFPQEEALTALRQIAQVAILVLKELYANYELEMLDCGNELLSYYYWLFQVDKSCPLPGFDVKYELGRPIEDLDEFVRVMQFVLGLIPSWVPLMRNPKVLPLKDHLASCYEINAKNISRELHHLEDLFLTRFAYTKEFHQAFFSLVFTLFFEMLEGRSFVLNHLSRATAILEELLPVGHPRRGMVLIPILKSAHTYSQKPENLPKTELATRRHLISMMRAEIPEEELEEWSEAFEEYTAHELLKLPIFLTCRMFREALLEGKIGGKSALLLLILLRVAMTLDPEDQILREVKRHVRRLLFTRDKGRLTICKLILPAEVLAESLVQPEALMLSEGNAEALVGRLALYRIPLTNEVIAASLSIMRLILTTKKENLDPQVIALAISAILQKEYSEVVPFAQPIARSALLALDLPFQFARKTVKELVIIDNPSEE